MWGSSFANLAKAAQEQAEAATSAIASPSISTNFSSAAGMFNLDSMQEQDKSDKPTKSNQTQSQQQHGQSMPNPSAASAGPAPASTSLASPVNLNSMAYGFTSPSTPLVTPVRPKPGSATKLVMPSNKASATAATTTQPIMKKPVVKKLQQPPKSMPKGGLNMSVPNSQPVPATQRSQPSKLVMKSPIQAADRTEEVTKAPIVADKAEASVKTDTAAKPTTTKPADVMAKPQAAAPDPFAALAAPTATPTKMNDNKKEQSKPHLSAETHKPISVDNIPKQDGQDANAPLDMPVDPMLAALDQASNDATPKEGAASVDPFNVVPQPTLDQLPNQQTKPAATESKIPPPTLDQLDTPSQSGKQSIMSDPLLRPPAPSLDQLPPQPAVVDKPASQTTKEESKAVTDSASSKQAPVEKSPTKTQAAASVPASAPVPSTDATKAPAPDATPKSMTADNPSIQPKASAQSTNDNMANAAQFMDMFSAVATDSLTKALGNAAEALQQPAAAADQPNAQPSPAEPIPFPSISKSKPVTKPKLPTPPAGTDAKKTNGGGNAVPDHVLEQFSKQIERLEQNHEAEQLQLQREFQAYLAQKRQEWQADQVRLIQEAEKSVKDQVKSKMEREWGRKRENFQLRIGSLERELEGTKVLLVQREKAKAKTQDSHLNELRAMESKMNDIELQAEKAKARNKELEAELEKATNATSAKADDYDTLKERVKVVASELKDRRVECRTLQSEIDVLKQANEELQDQIVQLQAQGMDKDKSQTEVSQELNTLRGQLMDREQELKSLQGTIKDVEKKGEDALATYKKKAQSSLSVANGRIASAVQAKEEAELEARAARSSADTAMDRAVKAESEARQKTAEAKLQLQEMEGKAKKMEDLANELKAKNKQAAELQAQIVKLQTSHNTLEARSKAVYEQLKTEQSKKAEVAKSLRDSEDRCNELMEEVDRLSMESSKLRDDLKRSNVEKKKLVEQQQEKSPDGYSVPSLSSAGAVAGPGSSAGASQSGAPSSEAETTIAMLRQELQVADQAIRDLKQTLKVTISERDQAMSGAGSQQASQQPGSNQTNASANATAGTESMPLFYAMEKQAELTQARNEIARLAGLVGDAKGEKQEALEQASQIREELHQAQSRLLRMEQLGGVGGSAASSSQGAAGNGTATSATVAGTANGAAGAANGGAKSSDGSVNLEYLKNIVLSYLNAKTKQERKTLLPVIGTVLCLTPEEQTRVMKRLSEEDSRVVDVVTSSLLTKFNWSS